MPVTRAQLLAAIDPRDWWFNTVSLDDYVKAVLMDDIIELTPSLLQKFEQTLKGRTRTLTNIRRLA